MIKKYRVLLLLFISISTIISLLYIFIPQEFQSLDNRIRDFYFTIRGPQKSSENIVIVDIDEKSIKELGQWPWERDKLAQILNNLTQHKAGIIGLDIVFSEADKTSPIIFAKRFGLDTTNIQNNDLVLAQAIENSPSILGYQFDFDINNLKEAPQIPAIFIEKNKKQEFLPLAKGVLSNLAIIQESGYSSGYMNNIPDETGMIRSVPLMIKYDDVIYPSLAFEMYRIAMNSSKVTLKYSAAGVETVILDKQIIRTDRFARLHINFRGPSKSYKYISAVDIYNNKVDTKDIQGKFILIGTSAHGLMDLRSTPMDSVVAGVEIHANVIDNLLNGDMLFKPAVEEIINIITIIGIVFLVIFIYSRLSLLILFFIYPLSIFGLLSINYYFLFSKYIILNSIFPFFTMFISLIVIVSVKYLFEFRQKEIIKNSFSKKVSKQVMNDLLSHAEETDLSAKEMETTIYFSDIRNFTSISETLKSPTRITEFLNFYMNTMVRTIEKNQGTIDKFIGDAIMAYWNAPLEVENHADKAVMSALYQVQQRDTLNQTMNKKFGFDLDYGIGINTGKVVVGEIGSKGRSDYTIIGDAVNLASRLEGLCKPYKVRLVISEFTKSQLTQKYVIQILDIVRVKGKVEPVKIYEVLSLGEVSNAKIVELKVYNKARQLYLKADFKEALKIFEKLYDSYGKYLYDLYIQRCKHLIDIKIVNFDGVFEFTTK